MKIWEYKVVSNNGSLSETQLNKVGLEGWELVAVTNNSYILHYFKREKINE